MKRAVVLLVMLLASALAGAFLCSLASANPAVLSVDVQIISPRNGMCTQNVVPVVFTYNAPYDPGPKLDSLPNYYYYIVDGQERVAFSPEFYDGNYHTTVEISHGLSHNLTIQVHAWKPEELVSYWGYSTVAFTVDAVAPRVSVLSPEAKSYGTSDLPLNFNVNENASSIAYSLDGQDNVAVAGNVTLIGLSGGEHTLKVYAWDEAGNVGASEPITFMVAAFPAALVIAAVVVAAAVVCAGLLLYFKRRKR